jgi:hypothetical protein
MSPVGLRSKIHCAGEDQQQFSSQSWVALLAAIIQQRLVNKQKTLCDVVIYGVCKSVRTLQLFLVTGYKRSVNSIINPKSMPSH